jgi:DNA sulfur modification protein DndB
MAPATTDKYPDHLFPVIDPDAEYQFSVVEGQQSGRPYWMLNLSVQDIKRMFAEFLDRAAHDPRSLAQRSLNPSRARKLKQYILGEVLPDEGFYILPPLVLSVDCDEYNFDEICQGAGQLTLPSDSRFWLGDGQHRAAGLLQAYLEAPALMNEETVGVMLLPDTDNQIRHQVFLDINANASKPSMSIATLFDERDRLSDVTRNLLALPWVERYTNLERTTLPKSSGDLFTLNGLRDANRELLAHVPESDWDNIAAGYWKAIAEAIPQWRNLLAAVEQEQAVDAPTLRQDYICFHSITLSALGLLGRRVIDESGHLPDLSGLAKIDWSRNNPDWEGLFLFEGKIIKNKQSATRFADYLQSA